jgi:hypothetical protein
MIEFPLLIHKMTWTLDALWYHSMGLRVTGKIDFMLFTDGLKIE